MIEDWSGKKIRFLTVLRRAEDSEIPEKKKNHGRCWIVKCDCGLNHVMYTGEFNGDRQGYNRCSPRCSFVPSKCDLTGKKFHHLTVVRFIPISERTSAQTGSRYWLTRCDCGNETIKNGLDLGIRGTQNCSRSCKLAPACNRLPYGEGAKRTAYASMKVNADQRRGGIPWELSYDKFLELTGDVCHYCGIEYSQRTGQDTNYGYYNHNGIDRIDNSKGYTVENSITACWNCNRAKNDLSYEQFKDQIIQMYEYLILGKKNFRSGESALGTNKHSLETRKKMSETSKRVWSERKVRESKSNDLDDVLNLFINGALN